MNFERTPRVPKSNLSFNTFGFWPLVPSVVRHSQTVTYPFPNTNKARPIVTAAALEAYLRIYDPCTGCPLQARIHTGTEAFFILN